MTVSTYPSDGGLACGLRNAQPFSKSAVNGPRKTCSTLQEVCALLDFGSGSAACQDDAVFQHVHFREKERICTIGQSFNMLYAIDSGCLKTLAIDDYGHEQVLGFLMKGDLFGIDGICQKKYASEAVALSDCDIVLIPFKRITALAREHPWLDLAIYRAMSRDLKQKQEMVGMMSILTSEMRVVRFLVWLAQRYEQLGYPSTRLQLKMSRNDIGNYLGLALETVSRVLSALDATGLISVDARTIVIHDFKALKTLRRLPLYYARRRAIR